MVSSVLVGTQNPLLYQVNTRVWLTQMSAALGRPATLDDISDAALDRFAAMGFEWVWFLSVWQTGSAGQKVSRTNKQWRKGFEETLPDLRESDIEGSGFAITGYTVHEKLGGDAALTRLRGRMKQRNLKLMLDFVPNHTALDHPWVEEHPEYYLLSTEEDLQRAPQNYVKLKTKSGECILAHGKDPYFDGWPDTLQLNYANKATQDAMIQELRKVARQCDGVRCDMAMLLLPDVFQRTWQMQIEPFWERAISKARERNPELKLMAEVYWDLEWALQQRGFDYTYDKRLYDRLREKKVQPIREHLCADLDFQNKSARFLENHDEPRAASVFPPEMEMAAAVITYLIPGLRFFQQGQFEGRKKHISPHLIRGPEEPIDPRLEEFYRKLLSALALRCVKYGNWQLLECLPAWESNWTWDNYVAFSWSEASYGRLIAVTNYSPTQSQCYLKLPFDELPGRQWELLDVMSNADYKRDGSDMHWRGLYIDQAPWKVSLFLLKRVE